MADLYYADFSSMDVEELISRYKVKVDSERLSKMMRTRPPVARVRSLLAGYLLQHAVKEFLGIKNRETVLDLKYCYGERGKPYLSDYPQIYFSLSHSGNLVACAVSEQEIGLDVQKYEVGKEGIARRFFAKEEAMQLALEKDEKAREALFFRFWSIKESYLKFTGHGISKGLDSFQIDFKEKKIREQNHAFEEYSARFEIIELEGLSDYAISVCMKEKECIQKIKCKM